MKRVSCSISCVRTVRWIETSTSGGSIDTDVKELTVMPCRSGSPAASTVSKVTTATPVANRPSPPRKKCAVGRNSVDSGGNVPRELIIMGGVLSDRLGPSCAARGVIVW